MLENNSELAVSSVLLEPGLVMFIQACLQGYVFIALLVQQNLLYKKPKPPSTVEVSAPSQIY